MNSNPPIIIAGKTAKEYLLSIGSRGLTEDEITLYYHDKHSGTVEHLLRILLKAFGWYERERGKTTSMNLKCLYDQIEISQCTKCKKKTIIKKCAHHSLNVPGGCQEALRSTCKKYKRKYNNLLNINYVIIEKLPQVRT